MKMEMDMEMEMENEIDGEQVRYKTFVDLWILMWVSVRSRGGNSYLGKAGNWRRSNLAPRSGARTCSQMSPDGSANGQLMRTDGGFSWPLGSERRTAVWRCDWTTVEGVAWMWMLKADVEI